METIVRHTTETICGKTYPLNITKRIGLQEIQVAGEQVQVVEVTTFESPMGTSRCCTRAAPEPTPEVRTANRKRIQEVAAKAMIDMGIW